MRLALIFAALAAAPIAAFSEELPPGAQLAASCTMCHGERGMPLAGMPREELVRTLGDFRSGARPATVMHQIAKGYTDAQMSLIADYFSRRTQ